jgi:hypothetical protein
MQWTQSFLIFTKFVSPLEKPRKRPQEAENQKVNQQAIFLLHKMRSKKIPHTVRDLSIISKPYLVSVAIPRLKIVAQMQCRCAGVQLGMMCVVVWIIQIRQSHNLYYF